MKRVHRYAPMAQADVRSRTEVERRRGLMSRFDHLVDLLGEVVDGAPAAHALVSRALSQGGLSLADVRQGTQRLSYDAYYRVLEWVQAVRLVSVPGLQLGLRQRMADFGVFGTVLETARTFGEAMHLGQRFFGTSAAYARMEIVFEGSTVVSRFVVQPFAQCSPALLEQLLLGTAVAVCREVRASLPFEQLEVRVAHARGPDVPLYRRLLGCRVQPGHPYAELRMPRTWEALPVQVQVRPACEREETLQLLHVLESTASVGERVRQVLRHHWTDQAWQLDDVAQRLNMSARTLRRRLAEEGLGFQSLLDGSRMELAQRLLGTGMSLTDISAITGYAHPASFTRAFRHHFGVSPSAMRTGLEGGLEHGVATL